MEKEIIAAIIAAAVSVGVWILSIPFEPFKEKLTCLLKLKTEIKYEQKKRVKEVISKYKMQLVQSANELNRRFFHMHDNFIWLSVGGVYDADKYHYFYSTIYRILYLMNWIQKAEKEMIYLDVTIAEQEDLEFVKLLKIMKIALCDAELVSNYDDKYDVTTATDHFFVERFNELGSMLLIEDDILSFSEFKKMPLKDLMPDLLLFLDGSNPKEQRYRWDLLQVLHFAIIIFLNSYGYDYQFTHTEKLRMLFSKQTIKPLLIREFYGRLKLYGLGKHKHVKIFMKQALIEENKDRIKAWKYKPKKLEA